MLQAIYSRVDRDTRENARAVMQRANLKVGAYLQNPTRENLAKAEGTISNASEFLVAQFAGCNYPHSGASLAVADYLQNLDERLDTMLNLILAVRDDLTDLT